MELGLLEHSRRSFVVTLGGLRRGVIYVLIAVRIVVLGLGIFGRFSWLEAASDEEDGVGFLIGCVEGGVNIGKE